MNRPNATFTGPALATRRAAAAVAGLALMLSTSPVRSLSLPDLRWPGSSAPNVADVRKAYVAAKPTAGRRHEDLLIRDADCGAVDAGRFACQIDFVRKAEPAGRLYFTVVTLQGAPDRWLLIGGLCQGP